MSLTYSQHQIRFSMSRVKTLFVLHSKRYRRLYPARRYPLTHLVDRQNVAWHCRGQSKKLRHVIYPFLLFLGFALFVSVFMRTHVYLYNQLLGPFHADQEVLAIHVNNYDQQAPWWSLREEYFQVELGKEKIWNSNSSDETIRTFSDPETRQHHTATFKRVHRPSIYVKLPTPSVKYFHHQFPFDFRLFTASTLRCIVKRLASHSNTTFKQWIEKTESVQFINEDYARNVTRFNALVLSKCGIFVGYLYRPVYELAFLPTRSYLFESVDLALDVIAAYVSTFSLLAQLFLPMVMLLSGIYPLFVYLSVLIRVRYLHPRGIFSFPLEFSADLIKELRLLNSDDAVEEQLLTLDSYVRKSKYRRENQIFVILNDSQQTFVLFLRAYPNRQVSQISIEESPFVICPVADI